MIHTSQKQSATFTISSIGLYNKKNRNFTFKQRTKRIQI
jgi:hypothetical protein